MRSDFLSWEWNWSSRVQSSGPSGGRTRALVSRSDCRLGTVHTDPGGLDTGAGDPGGAGGTRTHESGFSLDDHGRCADIQRLPGCPVDLTLNGRARPVARPHEVEPQCNRPHAQASNVVLGHVQCRAVVLRFIDRHYSESGTERYR